MTISIQISASQVRTWGLRWGRSVQVPGPFSFPTQPRAHLQSHQCSPSSSQQPRAKLSWHEIPTESYFTTTELKSKELKSHARTPLKSSSVTSEQRGSCTSALPWLWQSCQMPSRRSHCHETFHHLDHFYFIGAILDLPQNETAAQSEINRAVTNSVCSPTSKDSGHSSGLSMLRSVRLSIGLCFPPESRWNICSRRTRGQKHSLRHFLHEHLCCELWSIPLWHEASLSPSTRRALWNAGSHTPSLCHPSFLLLAWKISFLKASL